MATLTEIVKSKPDLETVTGDPNYLGYWSSLTGSVLQNQIVSYSGSFWQATELIVDVTASTPSDANDSWFKRQDTIFSYTVSQLANGNEAAVGYIYKNRTIGSIDYFIWPATGQIFSTNGATGIFSSPLDFNPATGTSTGVSGALVKTDIASRGALLLKSDVDRPIFSVSGSNLVLSQSAVIDGLLVSSGTSVTLPTLTNATDYKIFVLSNGTFAAQTYDAPIPPDSFELGGFHAAYSNAEIEPSSIWDVNFRPNCNPRAMTIAPGRRVWVDIYLADTEYGLNGYSRPNVPIADGATPPIVPAFYGGNGSDTYGSLTWFEAWDLATIAGKRLPTWGEFTGFAYGVVEQTSVGADPVTTQYHAGFRSACGVEQAAGVMWQWAADVQGNVGGSWQPITDGRGLVFISGGSAVLVGSDWGSGSFAGSRSASWDVSPDSSNGGFGFRGVCEHRQI